MFPNVSIEIKIWYNVIKIIFIIILSFLFDQSEKHLMSCLILVIFDNDQLCGRILCMKDEYHGWPFQVNFFTIWVIIEVLYFSIVVKEKIIYIVSLILRINTKCYLRWHLHFQMHWLKKSLLKFQRIWSCKNH